MKIVSVYFLFGLILGAIYGTLSFIVHIFRHHISIKIITDFFITILFGALIIALNASKIGEIQDLITIDIKSALLALGEITGEVITDDILNNIFENFCIGK